METIRKVGENNRTTQRQEITQPQSRIDTLIQIQILKKMIQAQKQTWEMLFKIQIRLPRKKSTWNSLSAESLNLKIT